MFLFVKQKIAKITFFPELERAFLTLQATSCNKYLRILSLPQGYKGKQLLGKYKSKVNIHL